jgi:hypothetical protein
VSVCKQSVQAVPGTPIQIEQRWEKLGLLELSAGTLDPLLAHLFCRVLQCSHGLRFLLAGICGDVCSKNSSLFSGYFGQGVPEELHMVVVQCGDRSGYRRWDDVGGVQAAPQANLKDDDIELLFDEYSQSEECKKSAECWAKSEFIFFVQTRYNERLYRQHGRARTPPWLLRTCKIGTPLFHWVFGATCLK